MKKMLIMLGAVAMATFAQAAAFKWTASGVYAPESTTDLYTGVATIFYSVKDADSWSVATTANMSGGAFEATLTDDMFVGNTTYSFYYTMDDASGAVYTSDIKNSKANATAMCTVAFTNTGSWSAVPEPTSGLLMLLGMAGLALKRKRA